AQRVLADRLGRAPDYTYWYGHSGGARLGKLVNYNHYRTGANTGTDGEPVIDGIIVDDSGAGLYLPHVYRDGEDILFATAADRAAFVPMLEIAHQLYINDRNDPVPEWVSTSFLINKYRNAKALYDKGLGDRFRFYEVRGISHDGGEDLPDQRRGDTEILPLWQLMDGFIGLLDQWVSASRQPPATRSDWIELGDADGDGLNENPAVAFPQVACPLGVYYPFPPSSGRIGETAFAGFDGESEEPFDGRAVQKGDDGYPHIAIATFADMNRNGYRDLRETVTGAWRRLELIGPDEQFSRARYVRCVEDAVAKLASAGFIAPPVAGHYVERARRAPLPDWVR
ncbi:MAG: alpha/beta hydrolase domain-containing protein, partial [Woeseiaceae bacterium]|nr:alpha/beta hydrolase domain-containing protein [Woeseiaceae bacterium]